MTRILKPEIQLEQALAGQIYHALEGDVVRFVLKMPKGAPTTTIGGAGWKATA